MLRTSSSNPMSIMRSASSMQRYLHWARVNLRFSSMSCKRPGVATTMWNPCERTWPCSDMLIPPMQRSERTLCVSQYTGGRQFREM
jgi:hypothetical protein